MTDSNKIKTLYQEAMGEFLGKQYDRAIELLSEAVAMDPNFVKGYTGRGAAFLQRKMPENAIADFDRVIALDNAYPKVYHLRGLANEMLGDSNAALEDFNHAIDLDPDYGAAYYSRATLHTKLGNTESASKDIEMVTHLTNRNIEAFANDNNIWRSHQLKVEDAIETEMQR